MHSMTACFFIRLFLLLAKKTCLFVISITQQYVREEKSPRFNTDRLD